MPDQIAIISDIHGNMPALHAVLADIRQRGIEIIYCLGDLVGKGPSSAEAVDVCRAVSAEIVRGNWDSGIANPSEPDHPTVVWHRKQLGPERIQYLNALPNCIDFMMSGLPIRLYHASNISENDRFWPFKPDANMDAMFANTDFTGYDHPEPQVAGYGDVHAAFQLPVRTGNRTLFNVGSVGNPLDMPKATYAVLHGTYLSRESAPFSVEIVRLPYDIDAAIADAVAANAPDIDYYEVELRQAIYRGRQKRHSNRNEEQS